MPEEGLSVTSEAMALMIDSVSVQFGGVKALRSVSLNVTQSMIWGLIGPNGAGKTTLFDVVSGIHSANAGRVILGGIDITHASPMARFRQGIRRTFQKTQTFGWLSVEDNILLALDPPSGPKDL